LLHILRLCCSVFLVLERLRENAARLRDLNLVLYSINITVEGKFHTKLLNYKSGLSQTETVPRFQMATFCKRLDTP
jgi:hypothetical protein